LVLAHSLKDAGTTKKVVVLVTPDTVSTSVIDKLKVCGKLYIYMDIQY